MKASVGALRWSAFATNGKCRSLLLQRTPSKAFIVFFKPFQISMKSVWDLVFFVTSGNGNRGVQSAFEVYGYFILGPRK